MPSDTIPKPFKLEPQLVKEQPGLLDALAGLLAQAFLKDPFYVYIISPGARREKALHWWMKVFLRNGLLSGEVLVTGTICDLTGVAIWLGPRKPIPKALRVARLGLLQAPFRLGFRDFRRMLLVTGEWQTAHRRQPPIHWYLNFLGVRPDQQGRGLGKALIAAVNERAAREGLPCYLETCSAMNVKIYERSGFRVVTEKEWGQGDERWSTWTMRCR